MISHYLLSVVFSKHILQTRVAPFCRNHSPIHTSTDEASRSRSYCCSPTYLYPVPLLLEALPYPQAARALAKSEWPKMPIPD
jgi:hypothetical protein